MGGPTRKHPKCARSLAPPSCPQSQPPALLPAGAPALLPAGEERWELLKMEADGVHGFPERQDSVHLVATWGSCHNMGVGFRYQDGRHFQWQVHIWKGWQSPSGCERTQGCRARKEASRRHPSLTNSRARLVLRHHGR